MLSVIIAILLSRGWYIGVAVYVGSLLYELVRVMFKDDASVAELAKMTVGSELNMIKIVYALVVGRIRFVIPY